MQYFHYRSFVFTLFTLKHLICFVFDPNKELVFVIHYVVCTMQWNTQHRAILGKLTVAKLMNSYQPVMEHEVELIP
jgi:hypothetical protein